MSVQDQGYANLLACLRQSTTDLPLSTIQSTISHYLAHAFPSPTPLAAIVVSSPLFLPYSHAKLDILVTCLRHAVHFKYKLLETSRGGLFQKGMVGSLGDWTKCVIAGLKGGQPMMRLAAAGGLLMGLEDISANVRLDGVRWLRDVQDQVILSVAESIDLYVRTTGGWEKEFQPETENGEGEDCPVLVRGSP